MSASTLIQDAFNAASAYWLVNAGGTRAGLIANLQSVVGLTAPVATRWVDALTQETYDMAISDAADYAGFKTRILAVNAVRRTRAVNEVFDALRKGPLVLDARDEMLAKLDAGIVAIDAKLAEVAAAVAAVQALAPGVARDTALAALTTNTTRLNTKRTALLLERNRLALLV